MTPIHTVSVSYVLVELPLVVTCNPPVMVCWFADILMVDLATMPMGCHPLAALLALQSFGSTPCRLVLPSDQTALGQMLTLVVALSYLRV